MTQHTNNLDPALQEAHKTLYAHVGKNLVMYQDLEAVLKSVLPMLRPIGARDTKQSNNKLIKAIHNKTLGALVDELVGRCAQSSGGFRSFAKKVSKDRNKLAHHFGRTYRVDLNSLESCKSICDVLLRQRRELATLTTTMNDFVVALLHFETETYFRGAPEYGDMHALVLHLNERLRRGVAIPGNLELSWEEDGRIASTGTLAIPHPTP